MHFLEHVEHEGRFADLPTSTMLYLSNHTPLGYDRCLVLRYFPLPRQTGN